MRTGTRQGCSPASVPPLKSNRNVGKAAWFSGSSVRPFPGACLGCVGGPGLWPSFPVLCVGLVPSCVPGLVLLSGSSSGSVSKRGNDPGHRPKDRVFSDRPTTCRAGSPWWPGVRGDDPRTDLLAGTPFYVRHYSGIGGGCWVHTLVLFVASSFFVFSFFARLFKPTGGGWWKKLHV